MNLILPSSRTLLGTLVALTVSTLGMSPVIQLLPWPATGLWPIAGAWAAAAWSSRGVSLRAIFAIAGIGLYQDFLHDAPLGAWSLALLSLYGVGLVAHRVFNSVADRFIAEFVTIIVGLVVCAVMLAAAGDIAGGASVLYASLWADLSLTGGLYLLVRPLFEPGWGRETGP